MTVKKLSITCWSVDRHRRPVWQFKNGGLPVGRRIGKGDYYDSRSITCWSADRHRRPVWQLKKRCITCWSKDRHRDSMTVKKTVDYLLVGWPTAARSSCAPRGQDRKRPVWRLMTVDYLLVGWPTAVRSSCAPPGREWGLFCRSRDHPWWAHLWQGRELLPLMDFKGTTLWHGIGINFFHNIET
jgi:hypothetical protein